MSLTRPRPVVLALALLVSIPCLAATARRRSVTPPVVSAPSGDCFTFGLVRAGLKASYLSTTSSGNVTFTITYISDAPTQTHTTQHVVTPQATADADTILDGEVVGSLRGLKHINIKTTTAVPVLGSVTSEANVDFVPSLVLGPAQGWCNGATWSIAPVTETLVTTTPVGPISNIVTTIGGTGEVLSADDVITVPAGTFHCVKYRGATVSGSSVSTSITWQSRDLAIVVRQDTLDAASNVTSTTTLQSVQ